MPQWSAGNLVMQLQVCKPCMVRSCNSDSTCLQELREDIQSLVLE